MGAQRILRFKAARSETGGVEGCQSQSSHFAWFGKSWSSESPCLCSGGALGKVGFRGPET